MLLTPIPDPFAAFPHFPVKLYSSNIEEKLESIQVAWVTGHYARWPLLKEFVVVLPLSRISLANSYIDVTSNWFI